MKINEQLIKHYLARVNDKNEIHDDIVPGQLVCDIVMNKLDITWSSYKIKYFRTIGINEDIDYSMKNKDTITVWNKEDGVKLIVVKIR
ncbi:hypothetical protein LFT63_10975 [Staphylococcus sp. FSL H8-0121]|uniref:hypothetical protein n=1 Tax=Staphylococcus pasteuri TaxID=45972 RepID=UPI000D354D9A|nr:hypothetical protein [Staphylococcus pasteuri]PTU85862.1 hypothetical protein BUZ62_08780 [Staphylococcus pasteuri]